MERVLILLPIIAVALSSAGCGRSTATSPGVATPVASTQAIGSGEPAPSAASSDPDVIQDKTFDDIKFDIEPDAAFDRAMLTPKIEKLFGSRIRIRGYIYPTVKKRGLKKFVLVRDNLECCFGPGAALYDCIFIEMVEGETAVYSIRPVAVEGRFTFNEFRDFDGTTRAIYHLNAEVVE